jgi:hypothetical protein
MATEGTRFPASTICMEGNTRSGAQRFRDQASDSSKEFLRAGASSS